MSFGTENLAQLTSVFNRRFVLNALLPTLVFLTLTGAVVVEATVSVAGLGKWWSGLDTLNRVIGVMAYVAVVWFVSSAVSSQWRAIVRFFEGYPFVRILGDHAPGLRWHAGARELLWFGDEATGLDPDYPKAYARYPGTANAAIDAPPVLPSRLGNILRAAERYSLERYGVDAVYFWPRIYPLLPESFQREYEEFMLDHEFPLVVAFESLVAAIIGGAFQLVSGAPPLWFIAWLGGLSAVSYLFYELSLASAEEVGEQQRVAFDLYRDLLLERWPTTSDVRDERAAFQAIENFILINDTPGWGASQSAHRRRR